MARGGRRVGDVVMSPEAYQGAVKLVDSLVGTIAELVYGVRRPIVLAPDLKRALRKARKRRERHEAKHKAASQGR